MAPYPTLLLEEITGEEDPSLSRFEIVADMLVGLLTAAHKNISIGTAQALSFLLERPDLMYNLFRVIYYDNL